MSKKNKFDLTRLVHDGFVKDGQWLFFVSDPSKKAAVTKQPNGEYKLKNVKGETLTVHAFSQFCLGQEPPDHAAKWLRTENGKTLYEIWHQNDGMQAA